LIVLVGFMGSGKTTVGRLLAARVGLPFIDTDAVIAGRTDSSIKEIFDRRGEPGFREIERDVALDALHGSDAVVALGGGALGDPVIRDALRGCRVFHLRVGFGEAMRRVGSDGDRPMLTAADPHELFENRRVGYETLSEAGVDTDGRSPQEVTSDIAARVTGPQGGQEVRTVVVPLAERSYEVHVGPGLVRRMSTKLPSLEGAEKAFVVTHESLRPVGGDVGEAMGSRGLSTILLTVPEGEEAKSLDVAGALYRELSDAAAHRHDVIVGVGGGVITDVAGFIASTYARGMPLVHVPTTLLGQVDAAVGGKTALNLPRGKNLVGTFYQPRAVICDVDLLATCPIEEMRSGMAEVAKYGFIADSDFLAYVESNGRRVYELDGDVLMETVSRSVAIKSSIVAADEREAGQRAILNYGHTFAHAIEHAASFGRIRHGEAVSIGMMAAAHLAHELGRITDDVVGVHRRVLSSLDLPVSARLSLDELERGWALDKKHLRGVRFVLLSDLGKPEAGLEAPRDAIARALERLAS
jgi:3-dehydroquinate synthase/shikimate kinase/3-dehydroquinate synthase